VIESDQERALVECKVRAVKLNPKGARIISLDLDWLSKVTTNAAAFGFDLGAVIFRPKGSPKLYAVMDADDLLELLSGMTRSSRQVS
jgi:hypothetical protein